MPGSLYVHDPDAVLDYSVDWGAWLTKTTDADTIASAAWTVPDGLEQAPQGELLDGAVSTVWVQGGVLNKNYRLTCHVVTAQGREEDCTIELRCRAK